ncbi:hypothetical protein B0O99DRAFT_649082 [Bisporella sp. PMI_857]|nr:hypothetical protein B0O99DRAFT_649082 [Bisporella sp. PMI_857]
MKFTTLSAAAVLVVTAIAAPTDYGAPPGGWESIKYPEGTGENLREYPPPPGGWENVKYPPGTGAGGKSRSFPFIFTSTYKVVATGSEVINGTTPTPGPRDAVGYFNYGINSKEDTICYNITLLNVVGAYRSPARTATHIHQAAKGQSGPPRIVFPNPVGDDKRRVSVGCLTGPFTTGLNAPNNGPDTGTGFKVSQIEANPAGFFTDAHTVLFPAGVVRGQLG